MICKTVPLGNRNYRDQDQFLKMDSISTLTDQIQLTVNLFVTPITKKNNILQTEMSLNPP